MKPSPFKPRALAVLVTAILLASGMAVGVAGAGSPKPPAVTGLSPKSGVIGSTLTIKGRSLETAFDVHFVGGDVHTGDITVAPNDSIRVVVPAGAQTGLVEVTT